MWAGLCLPPRVQLSRHLAPLATALAALRAEAVSWAVKRTPSLEMAEEIVQQALLRAMAYLPQLRNPQRLRPWFYQILRHVLADELQRQQRWVVVDEVAPDRLMTDTQDDTPTCACILRVLEQLPVEAAALLRAADLQAQPVKILAERLGLTPNATSVRLYRARQALRRQLAVTCGSTSYQACQNCDCPE